jgi:hypothetical protein
MLGPTGPDGAGRDRTGALGGLPEGMVRKLRELGARSRLEPQRVMRKRCGEGLRLVKAAQKAGLPVKRATVADVDLEFGAPEPAPFKEPPRRSLFKARAIPR